MYHKLAADVRARKSDGHYFDPNILRISENRVIMKLVEDTGTISIIYSMYMVYIYVCVLPHDRCICMVYVCIITDINVIIYFM